MANKWSAVWFLVLQFAGLSGALGQTPVAEGSGSCSLYLLPFSHLCTQTGPQTGSRGTTVSGSVSAYEEDGSEGRTVASGSVSYTARYNYGDLGIGFNSVVQSHNLPGTAEVATSTRFFDYVTISSATLPFGQPVALTVSGSLDWSAAAGIAGRQGDSSYDFQFWNALSVDDNLIFQGVYGNYFNSNTLSPQSIYLTDPHTTFSGTVNARVGDTLRVIGTLFGSFSSYANYIPHFGPETVFWSDVTGQVEALNSAHTFITASDSNIQLVALSGHNYAPPVPEPGTYALLLAGLAMVGQTVRRRAAS
jgi:hypothetical protein